MKRAISFVVVSFLLSAATSLTSQAQPVWTLGLDDNGWPCTAATPCSGGGANANFVQEGAGLSALPGNPASPVADQQADNDYYFAGLFNTTIDSVTAMYGGYAPVGVVAANEEAAERAFYITDNEMRIHFNLADTLQPTDLLSVTFDVLNLHTDVADPRWGLELYFNGVLVQPAIMIRPAQTGRTFTTPQFSLASVNAQVGPGSDNIVTLKGNSFSADGGGDWMGFDYVQLNPPGPPIPPPVFPWAVGLDDNAHGVGDGGGPNTTFVQENGTIQPLPGSPTSPEIDQQADNDYYFGGSYATTIPSVVAGYGAYTPLGLVPANEEAAERAFAGGDNDLRYHFNLPNTLAPDQLVSVTFDALDLDQSPENTDPRYGVEVYFNGVRVQSEVVVRPDRLGQAITTPPFTLGSVNAAVGSGYDNIVSLKGINYSTEGGGNWMGIDYIQLNPTTIVIPPPVLPWSVGSDDDLWAFGDGGGPNATFVLADGVITPLPGSPINEEFDFNADNDYYLGGSYSTVITGNGTYTPVGLVPVNEEAAEGEFIGADNELRYHFNLPSALGPEALLVVTFDALSLDSAAADPRYGVEVYFNNVLVQPQIIIRTAQLGVAYSTPPFTLASVNAQVGQGFDNILSLRGINYNAEGGGDWMRLDYVQLRSQPQAPFPWAVGRDDNDWPAGNGGGPNTSFVQENGGINPLPGSPSNPEVNQSSDNDYYFAGEYTTALPGVINAYGDYTPVGTVLANEEGAERAFAAADNDLRYHFNLPSSLQPDDMLAVTFDALNLDDPANPANTDLRYGVEVYFNGVLVQPQVVIRPAQFDVNYTTPPFTLASVDARVGPGFDNIVSLKGINYNNEGGGNWMGVDYVQLNPVEASPFPWAVGRDDNTHLRAGDGGGPDTSFMQENGVINPLPGSPTSPETDGQADNDYYLAGSYTTTIPSVVAGYGAYTPAGLVPVNEEAAERAFAGADNDLRYHFNLPSSLQPDDLLAVTFDALDLDGTGADPRYGVEVYFNGVLVQPQVVIGPAQLDVDYTTPPFTLASVNAQAGPGFDNIVSLKGISYSAEGGGAWMGIDYVQVNPVTVIPFPWAVGRDDDDWPAGDGGEANATFVQENGVINPLPGSPTSPETNGQADNDYYLAGSYATTIPSVVAAYGAYTPVGLVPVNEEAAERAFAGADNDLRYHFNLPNSLQPDDLLAVTFDANNLDDTSADPRYGVEVYFNGVLVQPQIVIHPAQLGVDYTTPPFTLASVNAQVGPGFDNIVSLKGISYSAEGGGAWMGIDYVQLNPVADATPPVVTCPAGVNVQCSGGGTSATWDSSAIDDVDGPVPVICTPPSGSSFPLGASNVVCTASDAAGNQSSCSFVVTVVDTTPPGIDASILSPIQANHVCGQTVTVNALDPNGVAVSYNAGVTDPCGVDEFTCNPPSGSVFPPGATTVSCTASDVAGNTSSCGFTVDVLIPNLCPTAEATVVPPHQLLDGIFTVISTDNTNALVMFDGSMSSDPDSDALTYAWYEVPPPHGTLPPVPPGKKRSLKKESGKKPVPPGECVYGRVAQLSLQYCGTEVDATVLVVQKDGDVLFEGVVNHGDVITVTGTGKDDDMGPEIAILVNEEVNGGFVTNGSKPIGPGLVSGDFLITEGWTRRGNELCRLAPVPLDHDVQFGTGPVAERELFLGVHAIKLAVSDGKCTDPSTDEILVEVITAGKAVEHCMELVSKSTISEKEKRPLIEALKHAVSEFDKGKFKQGIDKLEGFIKKVESSKKIPAATKAEFIACAQFIIDALTP